MVLELYPNAFDVQSFVFHGLDPEMELETELTSQKKEEQDATQEAQKLTVDS
jgi:hypothetical protein